VADETDPARRRTITWDDPREAIRRIREVSGQQFLEEMRRGRLPEPPFGRLLGIEMFHAGEGRVVMTLQPQEVHYNPMGCVHGGILATLLDSVMSAAVHTALPAGTTYLTREITVRFHRPVFEKTGEILADGRVVSVERRTATAEGRIIAADDHVYATGRVTCFIFDPAQQAAARSQGGLDAG
jgi:uncharacterized protein (TIGR00369 family)